MGSATMLQKHGEERSNDRGWGGYLQKRQSLVVYWRYLPVLDSIDETVGGFRLHHNELRDSARPRL